MRLALLATLFAVAIGADASAQAWNTYPLAFGMTPQQAADALQSQLLLVRGRPGSEVFVTQQPVGPPSIYPTQQVLFLQFRSGRLTGWKRDWYVRRGLF